MSRAMRDRSMRSPAISRVMSRTARSTPGGGIFSSASGKRRITRARIAAALASGNRTETMPRGPRRSQGSLIAVSKRAKARAVMIRGFCHGMLPPSHPKTSVPFGSKRGVWKTTLSGRLPELAREGVECRQGEPQRQAPWPTPSPPARPRRFIVSAMRRWRPTIPASRSIRSRSPVCASICPRSSAAPRRCLGGAR